MTQQLNLVLSKITVIFHKTLHQITLYNIGVLIVYSSEHLFLYVDIHMGGGISLNQNTNKNCKTSEMVLLEWMI